MRKSTKCDVVYWLGAGASYRALPVVGEMKTAFDFLHLRLNKSGLSLTGQIGDSLNKYTKRLRDYGDKARRYGTIDTYARALYLQEDWAELKELKLHLSLYFVMEQVLLNPLPEAGVKYDKPDHIDTRYMGWLAVLLQGSQHTAGNVNVISWNYDLQVEHALAKYANGPSLSAVHQNPDLSIFPDHRGAVKAKKPNYRPFLVHLNGVAGVLEALEDKPEYLHNDLEVGVPSRQLQSLFELYRSRNEGEGSLLDRVGERFTFAWEETETAKAGMRLAQQYLMEAQTVVIIGYSFPSFNRKYDRKLMGSFRLPMVQRSAQRIIVQNPTMSKEAFLDIFPELTNKVTVVSDVSQFYMPNELL